MGFWQPVTNLRDYAAHNPPVVTFFLCLLTLAVSFICLGFYNHNRTLPNPDTAKDWNFLLSSLSQLQLCEKANASSSELQSSVTSPLTKHQEDQTTPVNWTESPSSITKLYLRVPLTVTVRPPSGSLKDLTLHTTVTASQLKIGGAENVDLTLEFLSGNSSQTCLTISAPTNLLPPRPLPPKCPAAEKNVTPLHVDSSVELPAASQTCYSLQSKTDPTLTVMLTHEEQSMAVRHLLEVSVFLLVVCVLLCVTVSTTLTRHHNWNGLDLQNEPLIES